MDTRFTRRRVLNGLGSSAVLAAATGAASVAAGRASHAAASADWQAGASDDWRRILAEGRKEGQVTVAGFPALARTMPPAFKRDTGIELKFFGGRPSALSSRFEAEALAGKMTLDIMLGGGRELVKMKPGGYLNPVRPQLILPGVGPENFRDGKLKFMDDDKQYLLQGAEWVFGWLLVNKDIVDPGKIKVWKDILKPEFRGKMISHDPRSPGPGQGATNWLYNTFGIEFVKEFYLGQQAKFTTSNRQVVEEVVRGTRPISFASIQFFVEKFRREGIKNLAVVLPEDAPGYVTGGFSVLKQAKNVPHPNAAQVFINWYVSRPGQEVYERTMLATSRRKDVKTGIPSYLVPRPGVKYFEAYSEERYLRRKVVVKAITDALGKR